MTPKSRLSCDTWSSPAMGMPMAASLDADEIVGDVVAGLMDKWRLDEDQKRDLERS